MNNCLISIIIPTLNSAKLIAACLDSIVFQSFRNFEVIIIDAVSTDDTISIVKSYTENIPGLRWLIEADRGIYDAMNKGITLAKGEWCFFLGSDDKIMDTDVFQKAANEIQENMGIHILYGNVYSQRLGGIYAGEFNNTKILVQNICHQAIFFKKTALDKIGSFDLRYKTHADWDHNLKWFLSKSFNKKYIELTISQYGDEGFSSTNNDLSFLKEIPLKSVRYGRKSFTFSYKYSIWTNELREAWRDRHKKKIVSILFHAPYLFF